MTILNLTTSQISTIDETTGLQNFASSTIAGDKDDNDILASALPAAFAAKLLGAGIPINAALSGYNGSNSGGNAFSFSLSGAVGMGFTDSTGAALNGVDSGLKNDAGDSILLYTDGSDNNVLYGKVGSTIVFAAYLEEQGAGGSLTGAKLWMAQYQPIQHPDVSNHDDFLDLLNKVYVTVDTQRVFSLENAPSGQNLFMMFGDSTAAIVVTGKNPTNQSTGASITTGDTVNTSQGGGGTTIGTNNQMIDPSEGMYFTFVTGANSNYTVPNLDQNEADIEADIDFSGLLSSNSASFKIVQLQKDKTATIKVSAMNTALEKGVNYVDGLGVSKGDTAVAVDFVQVRNAAGVIVEKSDGSVNDTGISIAFSAGAATIVGVKAGYTIEYHTVAGHNRMLVDNAGTGTSDKASFDIGGFTLLQGGQSTAEIGSLMHFEDDGPAIALAAPTDTTVLNTQDAQTVAAATDTDSKSFAAAFALASSSYGADGAGDTSWSYALSVGSQGMDSDLKSHGATVYLYLISGAVVGSTSATEAAVSAANTVLQVQVDVAGVVTLSQMMQIDHAQPGASSNYAAQQAELANGKIGLTATALITDYDGDTASAAKTLDLGGNLKFDDDGPFVVLANPVDTTVLLCQDAQTIGSATDSDTKNFAAAFAIASSSYGADGAGGTSWSYAFQLTSQGLNSGLKSHGDAIYLYVLSGKVVGSTSATEAGVSAASTVFDIQVDSAGVVTMEQMMQVDHALPGDTSNYDAQEATLSASQVNLVGTVVLTDYDGDTATASKALDLAGHLRFADDGPSPFTPSSVTLLNSGSAVATGNLNATGTIGADVTGTAIFVDGKAADDFLYKSDGTTLLKSGGENIVLSGFGSDTLIAKTVTTQQTVFTAKLLFGTDQYTIDFDKAIDDGSGVSFLGAAPVKSGNPTFNLINNVAGTTLDLLFSGSNNSGISTVNVSTNGAGVANQTMNAGENLRIDFGTNLALAGSPLGSDFTLGTHQTVNGYSFLLSQNTPSGTTGTAYIKVYDADNDKALTGDADDVADTITQVKVNGIVVYGVGAMPSAIINSQTVMAFAYQGGVIITGLNEGASGDGTGGDDPRITVYTADGFNRVETTNYAGKTLNGVVLGGTDFDIGPAGVEQAVAGAPFSFQLPVQTVDYDGDLSPVELIGVNISPV